MRSWPVRPSPDPPSPPTGLNYRPPNLDPGKTHVITVTTKAAGTHLGPLGGDYYLGGVNGGDHGLVLR
ncbi:hypothetical protein ACIQXD_25510 [Streptomyces uncialis]|uniref:hypothetical protein n=1 Tax=Streptomyces uncialis TaxID=1048205 RepID=UPI0038264DDF